MRTKHLLVLMAGLCLVGCSGVSIGEIALSFADPEQVLYWVSWFFGECHHNAIVGDQSRGGMT